MPPTDSELSRPHRPPPERPSDRPYDRPSERPSDTLAAARERFLTVGTVDSDKVRETIAASWWRSRTWNIAADHVQLAYDKDPDLETPLVHGAAPVLRRLLEQLGDDAVSIVLTDADGVVLDRRTGDRRLEAHLDRVQLAPGFSYAEQYVGTNGIGTALEGGRATGVFGHEHYAENLEELGCAGVPVRHPVSGHLLGVLDLTCWSRDAGPLLLALAKTTAGHIERELTTLTGLREFALFQEYLRACRRGTSIVFALNNNVVMMNDHARQLLAPQDQTALLGAAAEAMFGSRRATLDTDLPSGAKARMFCTPVHTASGPAGGVVRVRLTEAGAGVPLLPSPRPALPGIAGSGALWQRACDDVAARYREREWITVHGEAGAGKLAVLRAVHRRHDPAGRFHVVDQSDPRLFLAEVRRELTEETSGALVLRRIDRLPPVTAQELTVLLRQHRKDAERTGERRWVTATHQPLDREGVIAPLLRTFPGAVEVPPLRHHIEDVRELVPVLLAQVASQPVPTCSRAALQLLMRAAWPGNIGQLRAALAKVVRNRRSGVIEPADLPPECRAVGRRVLSPLESLERDAIVQSLLDAQGHKNEAARALGLSRATIYRKIRDYGIDLPQT
ncbi:Transcriptional regulator of acetoin/glycerol metabolism [Actinacidiphila alni]|uniref:Transcriptional regulator of acetoin/glycerol metabolism n=1 Tax=Actinacidiphila alni TaxID=380248 RepID=A0A1I2EEZ9_9ACTN|nr:GAF domain-containing protein [Actinacidiphila alni]SFE91126.1 Transcriptional regulator of acetoin/glycerol metabolism [Actinacidiphila alni]